MRSVAMMAPASLGRLLGLSSSSIGTGEAGILTTDERQHIARLLVSCPDRHGIIAAVSGFLFESDANILSSDQHSTEAEGGTFFMRSEFRLGALRAWRRKPVSVLASADGQPMVV